MNKYCKIKDQNKQRKALHVLWVHCLSKKRPWKASHMTKMVWPCDGKCDWMLVWQMEWQWLRILKWQIFFIWCSNCSCSHILVGEWVLSWDEQMYCVQRYLEGGYYPHFYLGAKNREKRRDFRWMVKKTYSIDTDRKVLMKLVNMKKLGSKQWLHKFLLNSTPNCNCSSL